MTGIAHFGERLKAVKGMEKLSFERG